MLYFAYGSNMDFQQMRERCPSAQFVSVALLKDHWLVFTRKSVKRNCGVADAIAATGEDIWGVVYQIPETEFAALDQCEGFSPGRDRIKNAYFREERHVLRDGDEKQPLLAQVYYANREENPSLPNAEYKRLIVNGAIFWHLPSKYIEILEKIAVSE